MKDKNDVDLILGQLKSVLLRKQEDYGPLNIALSPGGPFNGLRVRMFDKLQRLSNLLEKGDDTPNYESIEDTLIDLANYAIIGILVQNGQWEGVPSQYLKGRKDNGRSENSNPKRPTDPVPRPDRREEINRVYPVVSPHSIVVRRGRVGRTRTKQVELGDER